MTVLELRFPLSTVIAVIGSVLVFLHLASIDRVQHIRLSRFGINIVLYIICKAQVNSNFEKKTIYLVGPYKFVGNLSRSPIRNCGIIIDIGMALEFEVAILDGKGDTSQKDTDENDDEDTT